jgi:hypothetical protein
VARRRLQWIAALLVALVAARNVVAAPQQVIGTLKAISFCNDHCHHGKKPTTVPERCCQVSKGATDGATLSKPLSAPELVPALVANAPALPAPVLSTQAGFDVASNTFDRAGPLYLLNCTLRR